MAVRVKRDSNLTVVMTALDSVSGDFVGGNGILHQMPVKCMEYSFLNWYSDAVSSALVTSAFNEAGKFSQTKLQAGCLYG